MIEHKPDITLLNSKPISHKKALKALNAFLSENEEENKRISLSITDRNDKDDRVSLPPTIVNGLAAIIKDLKRINRTFREKKSIQRREVNDQGDPKPAYTATESAKRHRNDEAMDEPVHNEAATLSKKKPKMKKKRDTEKSV